MKKTVIIILAVLMILSMSSCSKGGVASSLAGVSVKNGVEAASTQNNTSSSWFSEETLLACGAGGLTQPAGTYIKTHSLATSVVLGGETAEAFSDFAVSVYKLLKKNNGAVYEDVIDETTFATGSFKRMTSFGGVAIKEDAVATEVSFTYKVGENIYTLYVSYYAQDFSTMYQAGDLVIAFTDKTASYGALPFTD